MRSVFKRLLVRLGGPLWWAAGWLVPKDPARVVINAFPDFDDSTRALALGLSGTGRSLSILTTRRDVEPPSWLTGVDATVAYRYSLRGVWLYHRARYVLFTHGCFSAWNPTSRQVVVNIWHGMPMKNIGLLDGKKKDELPRFHFTIASDARFQGIMAAAFGVDLDRVLIGDHPRLDVLRTPSTGLKDSLPPHQRLAAWLPTYRASVKGDVRVDGDESSSIFSRGADLARVDALCARHDVLCIVKPHPMAKVDPGALAPYRSLMLVDEDWLGARGLSLYELLAASDLLITDVSSVYFDYRTLGRPVVLFCPDLERYRATRGFVAPIETLVSDDVIESQEDLMRRLEECFESAAQHRAPGGVAEFPSTRALLHRIGAL